MPSGIAEALSFDRVVAGGACPPCTTRDFLNYMKYVEHDAENLQFFLWYRDYCQKFEQLPVSLKDLSPPWTTAQAEVAESRSIRSVRSKRVDPVIASVPRDTAYSAISQPVVDSDRGNPFHDPPGPTSEIEARETPGSSEHGSSSGDEKILRGPPTPTFTRIANEAFRNTGASWKTFTAQPFRQETMRIISVYIAVDAPRQLNLSGRDRLAVLNALQYTTHPSAFHAAVSTVEYSLRRQAHPNFVRWTITNGNRPRVVFAHGLGIFLLFASLLSTVMITLSHAHRGWRVVPFIGYLGGISTLVSACMGLCIVLHGLHHTHLRPWELFADDEDAHRAGSRFPVSLGEASCESLTSTFSNSYEDEPWVAKYKRRNRVRKIFDREVWIQEPAIRKIQDTIFVQSIIAATILSVVVVGVSCAIPNGNLF